MSETVRLASAEPGAAVVSPVPNVIEVAEPGGVNWTMRSPSSGAASSSSLQPSCCVEPLGSVHVGHGDDVDFELHADTANARLAGDAG